MQTFIVHLAGDKHTAKDIVDALWEKETELQRGDILVEEIK